MKPILPNYCLKACYAFLLLFALAPARSQVITALPYAKSENFNTYNPTSASTASSTLPTGWTASGGSYQGRGTGSGSAGGLYAYGSSSADYSIGALRSGSSATNTYTVSFTNNSGSTITSLTLAWVYEQWRFANTSGWSVEGTGALAGNATLAGKSYTGVASGTAGRATAVSSFTLSSLNIANGASFGIKWSTTDGSGSDNGVAIDDFSISASGTISQSITFNALSAVTYGDDAFSVAATATSGLTVAFSSSNTAVATVSGNTVTIVGAGTANIIASQAGNASYSAATNVSRALVVGKKQLTVPEAVAVDKTYNGNTTATIQTGTISGIINSDAVTVNGGGTFANKNVNTAITVTPALTLSGAKSANYTLAQPAGLSADISKKELTVTNPTVSNKVFDGTIDAVFNGTLSGIIAPDDVFFSVTAAFDAPFAGTAVPVIVDAQLNGSDAGNYSLPDLSTLTADITPKEITITDARALNKIYDGNTNAEITGTLDGVIAPDFVTLNGSGTFASPAIGLNIPVTSTSTISGDISNYTLVQPVGLTANITQDALIEQTIAFDAITDVVYGDSVTLNATASSGLTINYESADANVATVSGNVVTLTGVGTTVITASQPGDGTYDVAAPVQQTLTVLPKELTITPASAADKVYDGNANATISGSLNGIVGSDVVSFSGNGAFTSTNTAENITVTTTLSLNGIDADKYTLAQPTGLTANITPKALTIVGVLPADKTYDTTTEITINGGTLNGIVGTDDVNFTIETAAFSSANAGQDIPVNATFSLNGNQAGNYVLTQPSGLSANINPAPLTLSGLTAEDKVYDRTTSAIITGTAVLEGILGSDEVLLSGTPTAVFNNKNAGNQKPLTINGFVLNGAAAANYTIDQTDAIVASITPKLVTITNAAAQNKSYDGNTNATITGNLSGIIAPDAVTLNGTGTFATAAIGTNISVTSTATLAGNDGLNYTINPQPQGLSANILSGPTVLEVGDLAILGMQVNSPDTFSFVAWVPLNTGTIIKFTDNGFLSSGSANLSNNVRGGENFIIWRNNGAMIPAGTVIIINDSPSVNFGTIDSGNLNGLAGAGDAIFAYQGAATSGANPDFTSNANPTTFNGNILFGLQLQGSGSNTTWLTSGTASSNNSYLPSELNVAGANIAIAGSATRAQYNGPRGNKTSFADYKTQVTTQMYWNNASGSGTTTFVTTNFTLATAPTAAVISVSGVTEICSGQSANLKVDITGGSSSFYTVVYSDGNSNFTVNSYISGRNILVNPTADKTYTLVSVIDQNGLEALNYSGSASIDVIAPTTYYRDADGDGYGNTEVSIFGCPQAGYVLDNTDCDDTDELVNPGATEIFYNGKDDNCDGNIDEGRQLTTQLFSDKCGSKLTKIYHSVNADWRIAGATGYRFRVTNQSNNDVQIIERPNAYFNFSQLNRFDYGTDYTVEVEVQRNNVWLGYYGTGCTITTPDIAKLYVCGGTVAAKGTGIFSEVLLYVTAYRFEVTNTVTNQTLPISNGRHYFTFNEIPGFTAGGLYSVKVSVKTNGEWSAYGAPCLITAPGGTAPEIPTDKAALTTTTAFNVVAYPNPFANSFNLNVATSLNDNVNVKVYDMLGKLVENREVNATDVKEQQLGNNYPAGVYNIIVTQGENLKTLRVIKR